MYVQAIDYFCACLCNFLSRCVPVAEMLTACWNIFILLVAFSLSYKNENKQGGSSRMVVVVVVVA